MRRHAKKPLNAALSWIGLAMALSCYLLNNLAPCSNLKEILKMCSSDNCLLTYFFLILIGFAFLIYFLLKKRESLQKEYLEFTADQAWDSVKKNLAPENLSKSNLLFGVWQDASATTMSLIVKDSKNHLIGQIFKPMGTRKQKIKIKDQIYLVEFPLTWNRTAILYSPNGTEILAKYRKTSWLNRHEYEVTGYGVLNSQRPVHNFKACFNYKLNDKIIGTCQNISSTYQKGRLMVFPLDIPLEVRLFILSV